MTVYCAVLMTNWKKFSKRCSFFTKHVLLYYIEF